MNKSRVFLIDISLNRMGGVQRILSLLANHFILKYEEVYMVSVYKSSEESFFSQNEKIKKIYLIDEFKVPTNKIKLKLDFFKIISKIKKLCSDFNDNDIIIFGRISSAVKYLPYIKSKPKIIVRDAINNYGNSKIVKKIMLKYFPIKVHKLIVSSDESLKDYENMFCDKKVDIVKIYNPLGIDPLKKINYNFDNKIIMSIGRFDFQKGYDNLIKAFEIVHKKHSDWILKIVGDGELKEDYIKQIAALGLKDSIIIEKSTKDVRATLEQASMFVMPSRFEGYANSLVEAVSLGIPSISYNFLTGVEEIINSNNGIIVNLKDRYGYLKGDSNREDVNNLANAIVDLIEDKERCIKMNENTKEIIDSRSNLKILNKWDEIITESKNENF